MVLMMGSPWKKNWWHNQEVNTRKKEMFEKGCGITRLDILHNDTRLDSLHNDTDRTDYIMMLQDWPDYIMMLLDLTDYIMILDLTDYIDWTNYIMMILDLTDYIMMILDWIDSIMMTSEIE